MYPLTEMESDNGFSDIDGTQSWVVELAGLGSREQRTKQFNHALRILNLKPVIHPSQLLHKLSAKPVNKDETADDGEVKEKEKKARKKGGETIHLLDRRIFNFD